MRWPTGLDRKPLDAKGFYSVVAVATLVGLAINLPVVQRHLHVTPVRALFWSAVINGIVAVPVMIVMMLMISNRKVMRQFASVSPTLRAMGWLATATAKCWRRSECSDLEKLANNNIAVDHAAGRAA